MVVCFTAIDFLLWGGQGKNSVIQGIVFREFEAENSNRKSGNNSRLDERGNCFRSYVK